MRKGLCTCEEAPRREDIINLPWFKGAETLPKGKIHVKIAKPYKKETAWKFVVFTGGGVRIDLIGAKGQISLTER